MKNSIFDIEFDKESGTIGKISLVNDVNNMNWCASDGKWGRPHNETFNDEFEEWRERINFELSEFREDENSAISVYSNGYIDVTVERTFDKDGNLREKYTLKNPRYADLFLSEHNFAIEVPLNDRYTYADECMIHHCNAHIWCGHNTTYINALKMGPSNENLGLVVVKGAFNSYSVQNCKSNSRGIFLLNIAPTELKEGEEHIVEWVVFPHRGKADFKEKAKGYPSFIDIAAEHYTLFRGERICFTAQSCEGCEDVSIYDADGGIPFSCEGGTVTVSYLPPRLGEYRIWIRIGAHLTFADFILKESFETLVENRVRFIVERQQYLREGSKLDGAFLIYDNKQEHLIFEECLGDHSASRERLGMILLLGKYLQRHCNERYFHAYIKAVEYVKRELFDEKTGNVYADLGKSDKRVRLYNAPWVSTLFTEAYLLTGEKIYLDYVMTLLENYYRIGGGKFYPNGISLLKTARAFKAAKTEVEYNAAVEMLGGHVDNMIKNKTSYPRHEVNFEQTIVSPAATFISEFAELTGDKKYAEEARPHIEVLERFNGSQPSFHLNEIPIRYWDDFWFGDSMLMGDTFPHYWSCLTARSFYAYYKVSGDKEYLDSAKECMRNCMCLFSDGGRGSAAYIYPYKLGKAFGERYDNWANDQDFALYFALDMGIFDDGI